MAIGLGSTNLLLCGACTLLVEATVCASLVERTRIASAASAWQSYRGTVGSTALRAGAQLWVNSLFRYSPNPLLSGAARIVCEIKQSKTLSACGEDIPPLPVGLPIDQLQVDRAASRTNFWTVSVRISRSTAVLFWAEEDWLHKRVWRRSTKGQASSAACQCVALQTCCLLSCDRLGMGCKCVIFAAFFAPRKLTT